MEPYKRPIYKSFSSGFAAAVIITVLCSLAIALILCATSLAENTAKQPNGLTTTHSCSTALSPISSKSEKTYIRVRWLTNSGQLASTELELSQVPRHTTWPDTP